MGYKVLIIDDEKDVRESFKLFLGEGEYEILEAEDGEQGIKAAGNNIFNLSLILCDLHMPNVDGLGCIEYLRREAKGIPIVVITGFPDAEMAADLISKGCFGYLTKPVEKGKFLETVKNAIASKKGVET